MAVFHEIQLIMKWLGDVIVMSAKILMGIAENHFFSWVTEIWQKHGKVYVLRTIQAN